MTYDEWLAKIAAECRCCAGCTALPCGGCSAGGLCDESCHCGDDYYAAVGNWWRDGGDGLEAADE